MKEKIEQFERDGYFVVENAISADESNKFRKLCDDYFENQPVFHAKGAHGGGGFAACGFAGNSPELEELNDFHNDPRLLELAELTLGCDDFIYTDHSDLHQDIITPWHRDFLDYENGDPDKKAAPFWEMYDEINAPKGFWDDEHRIVKIGILLQNHKDNGYGLWMRAGSHRKGVLGEEQNIKSSPVDIIVFDHRIMHRGAVSQFRDEYSQSRCLLAWGYGLDNKYTKQFMFGCHKRQEDAKTKMKLKEIHLATA